MTRTRGLLAATAIPLILMAGCARPGEAGSITESAPAPTADATVLVRLGYQGGFVPEIYRFVRLPEVTIYADGRVVSNGPVPAVAPGPALPNVQISKITPERARQWAADAVAAGVKDGADFGTPGVADIPDTVVTAVTDGRAQTVHVTALRETRPDDAQVTAAQKAARAKLAAYVDSLRALATETGSPAPDAYRPESVAVLAQPYVPVDDGLEQKPVAWPGPALPGATLSGTVHCVAVSGAELTKVWAAAATANQRTPWTSGGKQWQVMFRPLLPDETGGCAALGKAS
ncbi:hypothetical protein ACWT_4978 [Actinoplanes sp. SE50]|uniref:hypothetical protein n=1 Tax=unclassified Actinoplanes TaxID=2626549 RepID=UPI00023ECB6F|nr:MULTISPECIES: hypothetical protein [unclassified Actinoplanes]AEV85995.1 hypothetical protein ACPL_5108 [Actinoplanes sp. SE50/110]ATO84393.1 hypothetical protein ACWT_4978 [Actinoplanes sp. SE50]SLM01803.1 uncharacterized protein ACSP50_5041 [Actinoplanes sp. SE50/110]